MAVGETNQSKRVLFYSHDTVGLGHLRRSLLISGALGTRFPGLSTLLLTGSAMAHAFRMAPGLDYVKLPSVTKIDNEQYQSRTLALPFESVRRMRREIIFHTTVSYQPDFLFIDNVPSGMKGEIIDTLKYVRSCRPDTRIFLILRDILDDRRYIVPFWKRSGVIKMLEDYYDRIFVFGLQRIFDPISEYALPESIQRKLRFCGYIPRPFEKVTATRLRQKFCSKGEKLVLVTVGGGSDGAQVAETYLDALPEVCRQVPVVSVLLLGPEMDPVRAGRLISAHRDNPHITFIEFCNDAVAYMDAADLVVSMAGYNTISELAWLRKRAVVIPRIYPRSEQLIRSQRLEELGLLQIIHPESLTPTGLADQILVGLKAPAPVVGTPLQFTGLDRLEEELQPLMGPGREAGSSSPKEALAQ
ncbi:MAG: glycosyltransferase family protein [Acidobacteriota bacterium]